LLDGTIRSAFAMTEPAVASSDARNITTTMLRDGANYVIETLPQLLVPIRSLM
jgi:acyl-CoA dehydrogenase